VQLPLSIFLLATCRCPLVTAFVLSLRLSVDFPGGRSLEENCGRDVKAVAELFDLPSVQLTLFFQDQGHNTLAARSSFDGELFRFVVRDQNDEQFGRFRFFCTAMRFALQFEKAGM